MEVDEKLNQKYIQGETSCSWLDWKGILRKKMWLAV